MPIKIILIFSLKINISLLIYRYTNSFFKNNFKLLNIEMLLWVLVGDQLLLLLIGLLSLVCYQQITAELHLCNEPRIRIELAPFLARPIETKLLQDKSKR